jgi:hypothetical protein
LAGWSVGALGAFRVHLGLDSLPDVVAGFVGGLEEKAGLIGDVLEIAHECGAVFAGLEVFQKVGVLGGAVSAGCEEVRKLLLKVDAGEVGVRVGFAGRHFTVS